jgi:hypothetical protein
MAKTSWIKFKADADDHHYCLDVSKVIAYDRPDREAMTIMLVDGHTMTIDFDTDQKSLYQKLVFFLDVYFKPQQLP